MKLILERWNRYLNENAVDQEIKILGQVQASNTPTFLGRKIVVVQTTEGPVAFYRSSGTGTGEDSEGIFLPFGGICVAPGCNTDRMPKGIGQGAWLIKLPSSHPQAESEKFPKEGSEFYNIGLALSKMNIEPQGVDEYIQSKGGPSREEFSEMSKWWSKRYIKEKGWPEKAMFSFTGLPTDKVDYEAMIINNLLGSLGALKHKEWSGGKGLYGSSDPIYVDWQDISDVGAKKYGITPDKRELKIYSIKKLIALYNKYKASKGK